VRSDMDKVRLHNEGFIRELASVCASPNTIKSAGFLVGLDEKPRANGRNLCWSILFFLAAHGRF